MNLYHYFLAEYARMRFMEKYSLFEEEDLFKIRTRLIGTCLTIFKEIILKVNLILLAMLGSMAMVYGISKKMVNHMDMLKANGMVDLV